MRQDGSIRLDAATIDAIRDLYDDLEIDGRVLDLGGAGMAHFNVPPDELTVDDTGTNRPDDSFDDVVFFGLPDDPELFAEVARVLAPSGRFVVTFTNQHAPDTAAQVRRLRKRFAAAPGFGPAESDLRTSLTGAGDQLWAVWAMRAGPAS
jgi:SAM-dependent methyltransferase